MHIHAADHHDQTARHNRRTPSPDMHWYSRRYRRFSPAVDTGYAYRSADIPLRSLQPLCAPDRFHPPGKAPSLHMSDSVQTRSFPAKTSPVCYITAPEY